MPYETDERLKGFLDTNQLARERMCLAIIGLDKRFSEVRPRHPRGGPDGGHDLDATFRGGQRAFGAVGFVNQADDSAEKKRRAREKLHADLDAALAATPKPEVFLFITNVNFTVGEKDEIAAEARAAGLGYCDVFDRERLRIALDSPDGLAIRYQYLQIPLSEAEQAAFFARWGDDIQSVISTGFRDLHRTLNRLLFLQESTDPLSAFSVLFELDSAIPPKRSVTSVPFASCTSRSQSMALCRSSSAHPTRMTACGPTLQQARVRGRLQGWLLALAAVSGSVDYA